MQAKPQLMRDTVIETITEAARADRDIYFVSADFGAASLDIYREELPEQFINVGIAEQNMVDVASGLALSGKKVFLYAMAPFITARCYEQVKCVLSSMGLPVTLIAVGVGLGYDHAALTHFTPEDIACMRALNGIRVLSPADSEAALGMIQDILRAPAFSYLRLERIPQPEIYGGAFEKVRERGFGHLAKGSDVAIAACGYMTHKALAASRLLADRGISAGVIDLFRLKPLDGKALAQTLGGYKALLTVEEQLLEGGMGSALAEALIDAGAMPPCRRLGLKDGFDVVNGDRDELHDHYGIDTPHIVEAAMRLAEG